MSRRSWWLLLAAVVCMVASFHSVRAADEVRSGTKFNPAASATRKWVRRTVDSTGTVAGALDSAVLVNPSQNMPVPVTIGGVYLSDTSSRALAMDASGNAKVVDADRDRDLVLGQTSIINDTLIAMNANGASSFLYGSDSCIAMPVGNARHITLWVEVKPVSAADVRLAVQFRLHLNSSSDSNSVGVVMPSTSYGYSYAARPDSVGDLVAAPASAAALCLAGLSTETVLRWDATRAPGSVGGYYAFPRAKVLTYEVAPGSGTYFSVRVRNISGGSASPRVIVHYRASAL